MKRYLFLLASLLFVFYGSVPMMAASMTLQQRMSQSRPGDFMVTAQDKNYSLLLIRSITPESILLEEISIPQSQLELKGIDWQEWLEDKAPGHTTWTAFEIDVKTGKLTECYSYSKMGWIYLDDHEQFFTKLLTLPLSPVAKEQRKRIGPPPANGDVDRRSVWNPPLIIDGKKVSKANFEVWETKWPVDGSLLSLCTIQLYFSKDNPSFPFPYWLEVQSPHYTFKMRTIDSGHSLSSPHLGGIPRRPTLQVR